MLAAAGKCVTPPGFFTSWLSILKQHWRHKAAGACWVRLSIKKILFTGYYLTYISNVWVINYGFCLSSLHLVFIRLPGYKFPAMK